MYKNILLKLSGESLMNDSENINKEKTREIAKLIKKVHDMGINIGIVVGGGNFFRGRSHTDMEPINVDTMGMLGITMNALALRDAFNKEGITNVIYTPFNFNELIDTYTDEEIKKKYDDGTVIIFSGGTGHIGCSSDSAASLKAIMLESDVIIKLTNVDGVYDKDPNKYPDAIKYDRLSHKDVLDNPEIKVMDLACIEDCQKENVDILVINFNDQNNLIRVLNKEKLGTVITNGE